jgi:ParB-like chromosome segregation protein Spo0J
MALKIKSEHGEAKRTDIYAVHPYDLKLKEELRGRKIPPTEEQIKDMALSLLEYGQEQPIQGRRMTDGTIFVNAGFTRTAAGRLIVDGFTDNYGVEHPADPDFKIQVRLVNCNDKQAFFNNIVENAHRNETSPLDDAYNHERCRQQHGMSDAEITRMYRYRDPNKVGRLKKLLLLKDEIQKLVHFGRMGVQAAIDLLDVDEQAQDAIVEAAKTKDGKINGAAIREEIRESQLKDENADPEKHKGKMDVPEDGKRYKALSLKEIKSYFGSVKDYSDDEEIVKFAKVVLAFIEGKKSKKSMDNAISALRNAE